MVESKNNKMLKRRRNECNFFTATWKGVKVAKYGKEN
jgi:hypothetical protein